MTDDPEPTCPFCFPTPDRVAFEGRLVRAVWDGFPVSPGHLLIVPKRHVPTWFDATQEERIDLVTAIDKARELVASYKPDGYNIGVNAGAAAGQTVFHLHVHLIPRYAGDVPDPRGGVRHVIPNKGRYPGMDPQAEDQAQDKPRLVEGGEGDPLRTYLGDELAKAQQADIVVAFVMPSGVAVMEEHLRDFLGRGGRLRLLTGDYLGLTDPDALTRLLDLQGDRQIRIFETARETGPAWPGPPSALSFHPKAYVFRRKDGTGVAFVGSSNLSEAALLTGIEWNYRTVSSSEGNAFEAVAQAFDSLFAHPSTREVTPDWIDRYSTRRPPPERWERTSPIDLQPEPRQVPTPHEVQQEALRKLEKTREDGNTAGLVVLATGLGKTWLSAFDSNRPEYRRILFVAHREEILQQSHQTFRAIRPEARLGLYTGQGRDPHADVLFASIQTLGRAAHLERFGRSRRRPKPLLVQVLGRAKVTASNSTGSVAQVALRVEPGSRLAAAALAWSGASWKETKGFLNPDKGTDVVHDLIADAPSWILISAQPAMAWTSCYKAATGEAAEAFQTLWTENSSKLAATRRAAN